MCNFCRWVALRNSNKLGTCLNSWHIFSLELIERAQFLDQQRTRTDTSEQNRWNRYRVNRVGTAWYRCLQQTEHSTSKWILESNSSAPSSKHNLSLLPSSFVDSFVHLPSTFIITYIDLDHMRIEPMRSIMHGTLLYLNPANLSTIEEYLISYKFLFWKTNYKISFCILDFLEAKKW